MDQATVSGTWPNYNRAETLSEWDAVSPTDGWFDVAVTTYTCYVRSRCESSTGAGRDQCPASFGTSVVDIALLYCPNRTTSHNQWVNVASSDTGSGDVEAWWFHEIVNLSIDQAANPANMPAYNYQHYYLLGDNEPYNWDANYHYNNELQNHQLLPIVTYRDINQQKYFRTGHSGNNTWTNLPVCHGTSGSGVFVAGAWNEADPKYLGPVTLGTGTLIGHLCHNIGVDPGSSSQSSYAKASFSKLYENTSWVANDRL